MFASMDDKSKFNVEFRIVRSNRRSVVGRVLPDGNIEVRAPKQMTTSEINKWLDNLEPKFLPIVNQYHEMNRYLSAHPFCYEGEVLFRGEWIPIKQAVDNNSGYIAQFRDGAVIMKPDMTEKDMRFHISDLFCTIAKPIFEKKLYYYSEVMGVQCRTWTIGNACKRHGSCDSMGKITISWLVSMMNDAVIDYIIVHELAHLKQMNHSRAFHNEVAAMLPDWKERKKAHGDYCLMLHCSGWI